MKRERESSGRTGGRYAEIDYPVTSEKPDDYRFHRAKFISDAD